MRGGHTTDGVHPESCLRILDQRHDACLQTCEGEPEHQADPRTPRLRCATATAQRLQRAGLRGVPRGKRRSHHAAADRRTHRERDALPARHESQRQAGAEPQRDAPGAQQSKRHADDRGRGAESCAGEQGAREELAARGTQAAQRGQFAIQFRHRGGHADAHDERPREHRDGAAEHESEATGLHLAIHAARGHLRRLEQHAFGHARTLRRAPGRGIAVGGQHDGDLRGLVAAAARLRQRASIQLHHRALQRSQQRTVHHAAHREVDGLAQTHHAHARARTRVERLGRHRIERDLRGALRAAAFAHRQTLEPRVSGGIDAARLRRRASNAALLVPVAVGAGQRDRAGEPRLHAGHAGPARDLFRDGGLEGRAGLLHQSHVDRTHEPREPRLEIGLRRLQAGADRRHQRGGERDGGGQQRGSSGTRGECPPREPPTGKDPLHRRRDSRPRGRPAAHAPACSAPRLEVRG